MISFLEDASSIQLGSANAESNWAKHGVTFEEAVSVFADPFGRIFDDPAHSERERRELIVGNSKLRRLILVSFAEAEEKVRIIGARKVTRAERKDYEENIDSQKTAG